MADNTFAGIDEAFARPRARHPTSPAPAPRPAVVSGIPPADIADDASAPWYRLSWIDAFLVVQFLWGVFLFIPGAQGYRGIVRALPYLSSLALLGLYLARKPQGLPRGGGLLLSALGLLVVNLLHSTSQLSAGFAQCIFQLSIAAPMFWVSKTISSTRQLQRFLILTLVLNFASAGLGVLQVYFPERLLPTFSQALDESWVQSMAYVGSDDRTIVRPTGLTDTPGGAAVAGGLAAIFALGLIFRARKAWEVMALVAMSAVALAVIYLTQTRSILLMVIGSATVLCLIAFRQGRIARAGWMAALGGIVLVGSFVWATSVGGASVEKRYLDIQQQGAVQTFRANRGAFVDHTVGELLNTYPLGAGVGRWGMMNVYFADPGARGAAPIYVEIQMTGWLLDGGVPMWLLYGGAIVFSILAGLRLAESPDPHLAELASIVIAVQVFIAGMTMAGPTFNTQLGILFWAMGAALYGAANSSDMKATI